MACRFSWIFSSARQKLAGSDSNARRGVWPGRRPAKRGRSRPVLLSVSVTKTSPRNSYFVTPHHVTAHKEQKQIQKACSATCPLGAFCSHGSIPSRKSHRTPVERR